MLSRTLVAVRAARRGARQMSSVFESKNTIKETRAKYYSNPAVGAENPTYLKEPSDKIIFGVMCVGAVLGCMQVLGGLYSMSLGVNKLK